MVNDDMMVVRMMVIGNINTVTETAEAELCECLVNPFYVSLVEPALGRPGFLYVIVDGEERLVKGTVQGFRKKLRAHKNQSIIRLN